MQREVLPPPGTALPPRAALPHGCDTSSHMRPELAAPGCITLGHLPNKNKLPPTPPNPNTCTVLPECCHTTATTILPSADCLPAPSFPMLPNAAGTAHGASFLNPREFLPFFPSCCQLAGAPWPPAWLLPPMARWRPTHPPPGLRLIRPNHPASWQHDGKKGRSPPTTLPPGRPTKPTWPRLAAATGSGVSSLNISPTGRPSSSSITAKAMVEGKEGRRSCRAGQGPGRKHTDQQQQEGV